MKRNKNKQKNKQQTGDKQKQPSKKMVNLYIKNMKKINTNINAN